MRTARRGAIQGLRALAVLLVVAGHLAPQLIPGGFIGVDIFFVISGFVITQQMIDLREKYPKRFLLNFYARRIRRILPSALLVLTIGYVATKNYLGIVVANDYTSDATWVSIFLSNFHFQSQSLNYFASGIQISPLQHFWSLSIEEQFYLVWPALFLALLILKIPPRTRIVAISVITFTSLLTSLYLTEVRVDPIFFNTFPRIWELATGALLALVSWRVALPHSMEILTVILLITSSLFISQSMQWPRITTLPIIGLSALLLARRTDAHSSSLLNNPISRYIGDLSYLIYLWHWPILVIVKSLSSHLGAQEVFTTLLLTAVLSVITHHIFENPLRNSEMLIARPAVTVIAALALVAAVATTFSIAHQG